MNSINQQPQIHHKHNAQADKYRRVPKDYMNVAEGMERQFTNHLLSQMQKSVDPANPDSQAEIIYKSMLADEHAQVMAKSNSGLGVKDLVLDQIYPQYKKVNKAQGLNIYNQINSHKGENNEQ